MGQCPWKLRKYSSVSCFWCGASRSSRVGPVGTSWLLAQRLYSSLLGAVAFRQSPTAFARLDPREYSGRGVSLELLLWLNTIWRFRRSLDESCLQPLKNSWKFLGQVYYLRLNFEWQKWHMNCRRLVWSLWWRERCSFLRYERLQLGYWHWNLFIIEPSEPTMCFRKIVRGDRELYQKENESTNLKYGGLVIGEMWDGVAVWSGMMRDTDQSGMRYDFTNHSAASWKKSATSQVSGVQGDCT